VIRNQNVEILRVLAAFGIVWFHAKAPGSDIAYSGLTVFLALSAYFEAARREHHGIRDLAVKLLVPWAAFMVIFAVKDLALHGTIFGTDDIVAEILTGSSPHLWFLPFMFGALVLLIVADRLFPRGVVAVAASLGVLALAATMHLWRPWLAEAGQPLGSYAYAALPVCFGVAMARARAARLHVIAPLALAWMGLVSMSETSYVIGLSATVFAVMVPVKTTAKFNLVWLSSTMFGVYLVHPLALSALKPIRDAGLSIPAAVIAFAMSVAAVMAWRRVARLLPLGQPRSV
jgi:surface polysaccharide O-acyltransferase-like enzyme